MLNMQTKCKRDVNTRDIYILVKRYAVAKSHKRKWVSQNGGKSRALLFMFFFLMLYQMLCWTCNRENQDWKLPIEQTIKTTLNYIGTPTQDASKGVDVPELMPCEH